MCELDVPGMIHVSASCNEHFFTTGSHYLGADTTAFMQALSSGFMADFGGLRWVIPHGGGAVPYHWGRFKGMAQDQGWDFDGLLDHIFFDTCVYHQPGIDLLLNVVPVSNVLVRQRDGGRRPRHRSRTTGNYYDDTKVLRRQRRPERRRSPGAVRTQHPPRVPAASDRGGRSVSACLSHNIRRVYPRLDLP